MTRRGKGQGTPVVTRGPNLDKPRNRAIAAGLRLYGYDRRAFDRVALTTKGEQLLMTYAYAPRALAPRRRS